jgi:hypothetical protein
MKSPGKGGNRLTRRACHLSQPDLLSRFNPDIAQESVQTDMGKPVGGAFGRHPGHDEIGS